MRTAMTTHTTGHLDVEADALERLRRPEAAAVEGRHWMLMNALCIANAVTALDMVDHAMSLPPKEHR